MRARQMKLRTYEILAPMMCGAREAPEKLIQSACDKAHKGAVARVRMLHDRFVLYRAYISRPTARARERRTKREREKEKKSERFRRLAININERAVEPCADVKMRVPRAAALEREMQYACFSPVLARREIKNICIYVRCMRAAKLLSGARLIERISSPVMGLGARASSALFHSLSFLYRGFRAFRLVELFFHVS